MTTQRIWDARYEKAKLHLKGMPTVTKETAGAALNTAVRRAAVAGVNEILSGLAEDLNSLIGEGGDGVQDKIDEVFNLASAAIRKLLGVADIKAGKAHWASKVHSGYS